MILKNVKIKKNARRPAAWGCCGQAGVASRSRSAAAAGPIRFESSLCTCQLIPAHLFKLIDGHKLQGLRIDYCAICGLESYRSPC